MTSLESSHHQQPTTNYSILLIRAVHNIKNKNKPNASEYKARFSITPFLPEQDFMHTGKRAHVGTLLLRPHGAVYKEEEISKRSPMIRFSEPSLSSLIGEGIYCFVHVPPSFLEVAHLF